MRGWWRTAGQPTAPPTPTPTASGNEIAGVTTIGGRQFYAECSGAGAPTVVFEAGDEDDHLAWIKVEEELAGKVRVCSYDRLGNGQSDPATGCRRMADLRGDLEAVLNSLGERGPFVLVGASGGGYIVSGFAEAHPAQVAGLVLVKTHRAIVASKAPQELLAELNCADSRNQEHRDYVSVENDAWSKKRRLGDFPMTVISNDFGSSPENAEDSTNVADSRGWLVLSPQAKQVVVTTGHDVAGNEPDVVAREILRVLAAARAR